MVEATKPQTPQGADLLGRVSFSYLHGYTFFDNSIVRFSWVSSYISLQTNI